MTKLKVLVHESKDPIIPPYKEKYDETFIHFQLVVLLTKSIRKKIFIKLGEAQLTKHLDGTHELAWLEIAENRRHAGLGRYLLDSITNYCDKLLKPIELYLVEEKKNISLVDFYTKAGFVLLNFDEFNNIAHMVRPSNLKFSLKTYHTLLNTNCNI